MQLPNWIDLKTLSEVGLLVAIIVQYIKDSVPTYLMRWVVLAIGIVCAYVAALYQAQPLVHIPIILNGVLAAMLANVGYQVLKNTPFALDKKK